MDKDTKDYFEGLSGNPWVSGWGQVGHATKERQDRDRASRDGASISSSSSQQGNSLGLIVLIILGLGYLFWDEITAATSSSTEHIIFYIQQNWIWIISYPLGLLSIITAFSFRTCNLHLKNKWMHLFLIFLGGKLLFIGFEEYNIHNWQTIIFWFAPIASALLCCGVGALFRLFKIVAVHSFWVRLGVYLKLSLFLYIVSFIAVLSLNFGFEYYFENTPLFTYQDCLILAYALFWLPSICIESF